MASMTRLSYTNIFHESYLSPSHDNNEKFCYSQVLKAFAELGNTRNLIALDLDSSDNLTDEALHKFLSRYGHQLLGLSLSGMPHITDQLWQTVLPVLKNAK